MDEKKLIQTYADKDLTYKIFLSKDGNYIVVDYSGILDRKNALEIAIRATNFRKSLRINRCLLDLRGCINNESVVDNYEFAYNDTKNHNIEKTACMAMLVDIEDHSHDFVETVLRNNGFNARIFRDEKQAIDFLLSN